MKMYELWQVGCEEMTEWDWVGIYPHTHEEEQEEEEK